jgi:hypothetical protein
MKNPPLPALALGAAVAVRAQERLSSETPDVPAVATAPELPIAEAPEWSRTLEKISSGVVSIRVDGTRAFDTEWNQSSQATGFVVDAERGLILTNRHVVMPGPVVAQAIFLNREEAELKPVYRDPVHDFGIFHYDPATLKFIRPHELKLRPDRAQVGREFASRQRCRRADLHPCGHDAARREAPEYGKQAQRLNTFYIQAVTPRGFAGIDGRRQRRRAQCRRSGAATSFFLPLTVSSGRCTCSRPKSPSRAVRSSGPSAKARDERAGSACARHGSGDARPVPEADRPARGIRSRSGRPGRQQAAPRRYRHRRELPGHEFSP